MSKAEVAKAVTIVSLFLKDMFRARGCVESAAQERTGH